MKDTDHFNKLHDKELAISATLSEYLDSQRKVLKNVIDYIESPIKAIQKSLSRYMYVQPWVFEFLLKIKLGKAKKNSPKRKGRYTIYSRLQMNKKVINPSIQVDKPTLDALKIVLQNYPQTIVSHTGKILFYEEVPKLEINGFSLPLQWDERFAIARYMFASENGKHVPWMIGEIFEEIHEEYSIKLDDRYNWLYERIRQFNLAIEKKIGYVDFFVVANNGITLNEPYLFLLKDTHRIAQDPTE